MSTDNDDAAITIQISLDCGGHAEKKFDRFYFYEKTDPLIHNGNDITVSTSISEWR